MVEISHLYKYYETFPALQDVSLRVDRGVIFGLVGPNGSGKTTLIRAMVGSLEPSSGSVRVMGMDPVRNRKALSRMIGYMPQEFALYEDLTVEENLTFFASLVGVRDRRRIHEVLEFVELREKSSLPIYALSGGLKRRVSFAIAFVHNPDMLILDEPTAALDPYLRKKFWEGFRELKSRGKTIFVSTHLMDEISRCDVVGILFRGRLILLGNPDDIFSFGSIRLRIFRGGRKMEITLPNKPEEISRYLKRFGLYEEVDGIRFELPEPDDIIIQIFQEQRGER